MPGCAGIAAASGTGPAGRRARSRRRRGPSAPDRHLMSVDLPAPLSPMTREHLARDRARSRHRPGATTRPNVLTRPRASRMGIRRVASLRAQRPCPTLRIHWSDGDGDDDQHADGEVLPERVDTSQARPIRDTVTMSAPISVPQDRPRPPNRLVPPMTTAVIVSRLASAPALGWPHRPPESTHRAMA